MHKTTKKMERMERKKKKLAALINIAELNNKDRIESDSPQRIGAEGDHFQVMVEPEELDSAKKKKSEPTSQDDVSSQANDGGGDDSMGNQCDGEGDVNISHHKSKKKRKSRHRDEREEGEFSRHKSKSRREDKDEWPTLSSTSEPENYRHKRKSTCYLEHHTERPVKMVKRFSDGSEHGTSEEKSSFSDELKSLRKDIERSKKKEKKRREKNSRDESTPKEVETVDNEETLEGENNVTKDTEENPDEEAELAELRRLLRERKKQLKEIPQLRLKGIGKDADLSLLHPRTPILPCDVQSFILLSQLGHDCPRFPRWVELKKFNRLSKTVVLVVEGASAYDLYSQESECPILAKMEVRAEMVSPYSYNSSVIEELCAVAITRQQKKNLEKKFGKEICPEALMTDRIIKVLRSAFSITSVPRTLSEQVEQKISVPATDRFPRTDLLLSAWQLIEEGYPLPYSKELGDRYPDYVMTKEEYTEVTPSSPMWALDCEMCLTRAGNELTRVSVVDESHKTVYESLCLPPNPIINYLTEYSGITAETLKGVTTRLEDIQNDLRDLFPSDVILVGQSLGSDMHALKMMHPYVIDTSVIFNLTGNRRHKSKLARLSMEFLKEEIQMRGAEGHDSVEDSLAALKLVQLKLTKSMEYGDAVLSGMRDDTNTSNTSSAANGTAIVYQEHNADEFDDLKLEVGPMMATSLFKHITMRKRSVAVVGPEEKLAEYSTFVAAAHRENKNLVRTEVTNSNSETIDIASRQCKNNNFTLAHVILGDEEDVTVVDSWLKRIHDCPPFNSLFIVVLAGSHKSFANGACLAMVKRPSLKLKPRKAD
uniref:Exonuclease domain-containing protein n=2 Tax=Graphocephala atropunctata TaxID=36148 RepID=A0A1B6LU42_9HEMI